MGRDGRQTVRAEEWGYDSIWVSEHHGVDAASYPTPWLVLAGLASHTARVELGTAVLLAPLYHPFHIAEDATMLDVISNGRCVLGLGLGHRAEEFALFGVSPKERGARTEEATRIVLWLWAEERVTHRGTYYQLEGARLLPRPIRKPRPPVWMGGLAEAACDRAARLADAWFPGPTADLAQVKASLGMYRKALGVPEDEFRKRPFPLKREVFCCKDRAAEEEGLERLKRTYEAFYLRWGEAAGRAGAGFETLMKDRFIVGPPERCIEGLERFVDELGCNHLILRMHFHEMRHEAALDSMKLFADECMPHLKKRYGAG